jgi:DNA-binding NtrC family response regulator
LFIKSFLKSSISLCVAPLILGGAPYKMTPAKLRLAQAAMENKETKISELCKELGITRQTLYRHVSPDGELRNDGKKLLKIP